jgi:hypothetical protein
MIVRQGSNTACEVEIVTPEGIRLVFDTTEAVSDLMQVQTHYDMGEVAGAFSLTFAPRRIQGRTYDQLIPLRSLVTIRMESPIGHVSKADSTVMVGLTEDHGMQEDYSRGQPQRLVTVTGRSMALVFLDMQLRYFPGIANDKAGTLTVGDQLFNLFIPATLIEPYQDPRDALRTVLAYFTGLPNRKPLPSRRKRVEVQQGTEQQKAAQPDRSTESIHREQSQKAQARPAAVRLERPAPPTPTADLTTSVDYQREITKMIAANPGMSRREAGLRVADMLPSQKGTTPAAPLAPAAPPPPPPVKKVPSPQTRAVAEDPRLTGPPPSDGATVEGVVRRHNVLLNLQLPGLSLADLLDMNDHQWTVFDEGIRVYVGENTPYALTLWQFLLQFVDDVFQEFFTRVEDGVIKIHFRGKPFAQTFATTGSRFIEDEPTLKTLTFTRDEWESIYIGSHLRRQTQNVYNTFQVIPRLAGTLFNEPGFEWRFVPRFLDKPEHPSYLLKYGIRLLKDATPYLTTKVTGQSDPTSFEKGEQVQRAGAWARVASAWYGWGPEMYAGTITVLGGPQWNIGNRLQIQDERGDREFYIEGVTHLYDCRTGRYITQLRVTRGWYLAGLVDEREATMPFTLGLEVVKPTLNMEVVTPHGP